MANSSAQKPLTLDEIKARAKSMGVPATALMDMLAGTLRGATASTLGTPADLYNLANTISGDRLGNIPYDTEYFKSKLPPTIPGNDASRAHTAGFGEDFGTLAGADAIQMAKLAGKGVAKGAKLAGQEIADRVATGQRLIPGVGEPQMAMFAKEPSKLFSSVDKTAAELPRAKGTGKEFMTELTKKPGVKKAELSDRNLHEINDLPKMTKDEFQAELAKRPKPTVTKKIINDEGGQLQIIPHNPDSILDDRHWVVDNNGEPVTAHPFPSRSDAESHIENHEEEDNLTKYKDYKLPGGDNYQEHLYQLPSFKKTHYAPGEYLRTHVLGGEPVPKDYYSSHWEDIPNVLAHARTVDRMTPEGKKILHVEEMQSDWHQDARNMGYAKNLTLEEKEELDRLKKIPLNNLMEDTPNFRRFGELIRKNKGVPEAPFKKNWEEMVSKDLIKHAVDNGYDGIALTPGKEQADRYSLKHHIGEVYANPTEDGKFHLTVNKKNGDEFYDTARTGPININEIQNLVGKELAEKIASQEKEHTYSGLDLEVGGEGMKAAYDKRIPNAFNDIGKTYGAEMKLNELPVLNGGNHYANRTIEGDSFNVMDGNDNIISNHPTQQEANIKARELNSTPLHYMEFTPEMKQGVGENSLPAYADGGQVEHPGFLNPSLKLANGEVTLNPLEFMPNYLRGGKVHVADDLDMMRHEIHMSKGGILTDVVSDAVKAFTKKADKVPALPLKLERAAPKTKEEIDAIATRVAKQMNGEHVTSGKPKDTQNLAGRSVKESQRVKNLPYVLEPTGAAQKAQPYTPKIGDVNIAFPGDQTVSDSVLRHVGDINDLNAVSQGGAKYGLGKMNDPTPLFWASGFDPAKMAQDKATRLQGFYNPDRVIAQHLAMGPTSNNFAMHLADANLRGIDWSKATKYNANDFDNLIANGFTHQGTEYKFPNWPGIADPENAYKAMQEDPELRKWFNNRMKTRQKVTEPLNLPNGLDMQWAMSEPAIRNMEINMTGLSAGQLVPGADLTETAAHNTYSHGIPGMALQPQTPPAPFEITFPDATQHVRATKNPSDFTGTIQKVFPHQLVDDQYLNELGQYNDLIKKYTGQKKGGKIKAKKSKVNVSNDPDMMRHELKTRG